MRSKYCNGIEEIEVLQIGRHLSLSPMVPMHHAQFWRGRVFNKSLILNFGIVECELLFTDISINNYYNMSSDLCLEVRTSVMQH